MRKIPKSGEAVPVIGLGTAQSFGDETAGPGFDARKQVIKTLLEGGGAVIDTAPTYRQAEKVVGRALAELNGRSKCFLATKISIQGEQAGIDQHARSVKDLRSDKIDLLAVHNLKDTDAHMRTIGRLKEEGRVRYVGATTSRTSVFPEMAEVMKKYPVDWVQINYSLDSREAEKTLLPLARDRGIAVMINLPFGRGRLFRKTRGTPVPAWAAEFDARTWAQFFLKHLLGNEAVTCLIPGTTKAHHMADNLGAGMGRLPTAAHLRKMVELIDSL